MKRKSRPGTRFGRRGVAGLREPLDRKNKQRFKNSFRLTGGCKADLCPCLRWWRGECLAAAGVVAVVVVAMVVVAVIVMMSDGGYRIDDGDD